MDRFQTANRQTQADAEPIIVEKIVEMPPQIVQMAPQQPVIEERAFKQTTTKRRIENEQTDDADGGGVDDISKVFNNHRKSCPYCDSFKICKFCR